MKELKIAVLGNTATHFLVQALRGVGFEKGYDPKIWEADFNQVERQVFDTSSEPYEYNPEVVIIFQSAHKLLAKYNKMKPEKHIMLSDSRMELVDNLCNTINAKLKSKVIYYNYIEINDSLFGNYSNKTTSSYLYQLRKLNYQLMVFAANQSNFYLCDISTLQNHFGKTNFFQPSLYINADMVLSIKILPAIAALATDVIAAMNGKFKKYLKLN